MSANYDADLVKGVGETYDIQFDSDGDIKTVDFFEPAILMSLFAERRATSSEMPVSQLRRGWIGNEQYADGFENGSKLWLYEQARVTRSTLNGIETAIYNGLQWLIDDQLATNIEVEAALKDSNITMTVTIERSGSKVEKRYYQLWENTGV